MDTFSELLLAAVKKNSQKQIPTIVFCNKSRTVQYVAHMLQECGVKSMSSLFVHKRHRAVSYLKPIIDFSLELVQV